MEKQQIFKALLAVLAVGIVLLSIFLFGGGKKQVDEVDNLADGLAPVSSVEVLILESFPVQVRAVVTGSFSNGCWKMGGSEVAQDGNSFDITLSAFEPTPDIMCTQAIVDFEESVSLDVYGLPAGTYSVSVNGVSSEFVLAVDNILNEQTGSGNEEASSEFEGEVLAGNASPFIDFNQADYEKAIAGDQTVLLYFYARWCPTCKKELRDALEPAFNTYQGDDVVGFRVNYKDKDTSDLEESLAADFGVLYQHTKVVLENGEVIDTFPNSWTESDYLSYLEARN